jgi:GxxExxY protein
MSVEFVKSVVLFRSGGSTVAKLIYENLTYEIRGALFEVYGELRNLDLPERAWENAVMIAFEDRQIPCKDQVVFEVFYKDERVGLYVPDLIAYDKIVIELKAVDKLEPIHKAQVLSYLKVTDKKLGMLVNFGGPDIEIQRIPNFLGQTASQQSQDAPEAAEEWLYPELIYAIRGVLFEVHRELGPGFMHHVYRRAMQIELRLRDISYEFKRRIPIYFRGQLIESRECRLLAVENKVLLAAIAVREITDLYRNRFKRYLRLLDLNIGLMANFHSTSLDIETLRV